MAQDRASGSTSTYPKGAGPDAPLLVFFYGGNWERGAKADYAFVGQAFASRGYVTAIPDYRLYPQVRYPAFLAGRGSGSETMAGGASDRPGPQRPPVPGRALGGGVHRGDADAGPALAG